MNVLDLFSGIGGFSLGLERAGFKTVAFCEIEKYPQQILKQHWPGVPIYDDIKTLTKERLFEDGIDDIGLICGGYPCQPFSVAGQQKGEADDRHLWPEMYRLIKTIRPRWVIAENVAGHINMGLDAVLSDLETENYTCWPFVIPACAVNAIHRRDRVWIIGYTEHDGLTAAEKREGDHKRNDGNTTRQKQASEFKRSGITDVMADTKSTEPFRDFRHLEPPTEPPLCRADDGIPNRSYRLKSLGNAVVPQIPELIGRAIMEVENERP